ncbi:hypothetical protein SEA_AFFECA_71 [Gordonia phage Affeca]|nr:hypothetical protein SEA_AFFECA_71 [Gordonia phage Affeca]
MTGPDPARATADAIADRLTSTILARYQGDSMTKQADPNGRTPIGPLPAALGDYKPPLYVQAMLETATAEGRAEALAEQLSDLSLDRMALVDRLVDREREAASVIVDLHVANARAVDDATQARALLSSATTRADELQAELDSDPRRAVLQQVWDSATTAITAIGGSNLDGIDTAGRVELLAERAIELYAANEHDVDGVTATLLGVEQTARVALTAHHEMMFPHEDIGIPVAVDQQVTMLAGYLADARHRVQQLTAANAALQDTANGRHSVVGGEVREHTEQAPTGGVEVGHPYEQTIADPSLPEQIIADLQTAEAAQREHQVLPTPSPASPCANCGHGRDKHDPGAYWNADQRAIHRSCEPPCPCTVYVPVAPKPS